VIARLKDLGRTPPRPVTTAHVERALASDVPFGVYLGPRKQVWGSEPIAGSNRVGSMNQPDVRATLFTAVTWHLPSHVTGRAHFRLAMR
jgi:hypothetical protein